MNDTIRSLKKYEMSVPASPEQVFPLLCPVKELEWLPYWNCEMIYSKSGVAELDCVFKTDLPDRGKMVWVVTQYEPPKLVQYTILKPQSHTLNLTIRVRSEGSNSSLLIWQHVFTSLTDEGNQYLREYTDENLRLHLQKIEECLVHFLKTGEMM